MVLPVQYKKASQEDLEDLLKLEKQCFDQGGKSDKVLTRYFYSPDADCVVATLGQQVIGYVLTVSSPNHKKAAIQVLCVEPGFRKRGIGENLLILAEIEALKSGAHQITFIVPLGHDVMINILRLNDYLVCGPSLSVRANHGNGIKMKKRLVPSVVSGSLPQKHVVQGEQSVLKPTGHRF